MLTDGKSTFFIVPMARFDKWPVTVNLRSFDRERQRASLSFGDSHVTQTMTDGRTTPAIPIAVVGNVAGQLVINAQSIYYSIQSSCDGRLAGDLCIFDATCNSRPPTRARSSCMYSSMHTQRCVCFVSKHDNNMPSSVQFTSTPNCAISDDKQQQNSNNS